MSGAPTSQGRRRHAFVVGTGRCGSTLLGEALALHPQIVTISEFLAIQDVHAFSPAVLDGEALWRRLSRPRKVLRAGLPAGSQEVRYPFASGRYDHASLPPLLYATLPALPGDCEATFDALEAMVRGRPRAPIEAHYRAIFEAIANGCGARTWVERSGYSILMLRTISARFPEAKIVHIVRDGRDVAMSMQRHPAFCNLATQWLRFERIGVDFLNPPGGFGASAPFAVLEPIYARLTSYQRAAAIAHPPATLGRMWAKMTADGVARLARIEPARLHTVRYEDLVQDPRGTLAALASFLGEDAGETWLARAAELPNRRPSRWRSLAATERKALEEACAPGLDALGYAR